MGPLLLRVSVKLKLPFLFRYFLLKEVLFARGDSIVIFCVDYKFILKFLNRYICRYDNMKTWLKSGEVVDTKPLAPGQHLFAATWAGLVSLVVLNPVSVVKTRLVEIRIYLLRNLIRKVLQC